MENRGTDGIWELRVLSTCSVNSQNLPRFARIYWKKMENRGNDWIWQVSRINSTWRMNFQNVPCFFLKKMENLGKTRLDVASQYDTF